MWLFILMWVIIIAISILFWIDQKGEKRKHPHFGYAVLAVGWTVEVVILAYYSLPQFYPEITPEGGVITFLAFSFAAPLWMVAVILWNLTFIENR